MAVVKIKDTAEYKHLETKHKALNNLVEQVKSDFQRELFKFFTKALFDRHSSLQSFGWKQYANYYCDGGPCNFYVCSDNLDINEKRTNYGDKFLKPEDRYAYEDACIVIGSLDEEMLKLVFGPEQSITVHRDGRIDNTQFTDHE